MSYVYTGPEVVVGKFQACAIQKFHIDKLKFRSGTAAGTIKIMDYIESCALEHDWAARKKDGVWTVWCTDKPRRYSCFEEGVKIAFTWEPTIDEDMKKFIAEKLILFEESRAAA